MRWTQFVILATWAAAPVSFARSIVADCLIGFGAVSSAGEAAQLTRTTYRQLVETLAPGMSAEAMARVIEGGDPFAIPTDENRELFALAGKIKQFRAMLTDKGWDTEPIRRGLLEELGRRARQNQAEENDRALSLVRSHTSYDLAFPTNESPSGAGRQLVAVSKAEPFRLLLHDLSSRNHQQVPLASGPWNPPALAANGKEIFLPALHSVYRIPIENGVPNVEAAVHLINPLASGSITEVKSDPAGKYLYASNDDNKLARFDLKTNKGVRVDMSDFYGGRSVRDWGLVPGNNNLWIIEQGDNGCLIHRFKVGARGKATAVSPPVKVEQWVTGLTLNSDGKTGVAFSHERQGGAYVVDLSEGKAISLVPEGEPNYGTINRAVAHPTKPEAAMLVLSPDSTSYRLEIVDVAAKKVVKRFEFGRLINSVSYTPDGEGLVITERGRTRVYKLDYLMAASETALGK